MSAHLSRMFGSGPAFPLALFVTLAGALFACVDDPAEPPSAWPVTLRVVPVGEEPVAVGETVSLTAEVRDRQGKMMSGPQVRWTSDDTLVAKVDTAGLVTAVGEGTATITATAGAATATVQFAVADPTWAVLYALYVSTGGDNWTNNDNWFENDSLHTWHGVVWDPPCYLDLELEDNNLRGRIPPELGDLNCLGELDLSGNHLTGEIPEELSSLALWRLDLSGNRLNGSIPTGIGGSRLQQLDLSSNDLMGSIPVDTLWSRLWSVSLDNNRLTGSIPSEFGRLGGLDHLSLRGNQLTGTIPPELGNLASLDNLNLSDNNLSGPIPPELGSISGLDTLWLSHNRLSGPIPSELGNLTELDVLWLSHNYLTSIPPASLGDLEDLAWLLIGDNRLSGPLPVSLVDVELETFGFANTDLCIPDDEAFRLWLDSIPWTGGTDFTCDAQTDRAVLEVFYNATGGPRWQTRTNWLTERPLGEWYGVETDTAGRVVRLVLRNNDLVGALPAQLGGLGKLRTLVVFGDPDVRGNIPSELGNLSGLDTLDLGHNELTGGILRELGDLDGLLYLRLSANDLTGPIPAELASISQLRFLSLGSNDLTGAIPPALGELMQLEDLDLGRNDLTGTIPPELGNLTNLELLYLDGNELGGAIPAELGNLLSLVDLRLSSNDLTGPIPRELERLTNLEFLTLAQNELTGGIPGALGNLRNLTNLRFDQNPLVGPLPLSLVSIPLEFFIYNNTRLCNPADAAFSTWLASITRVTGTHIECTDRNVLEVLYQTTGGPNWTDNTNWLTDEDIGSWHGVTVNSVGRVTNLNLFGNNSVGIIPSQLEELDSLRSLVMAINSLTGPIPSEVGNLTKLTDLRLENNQLSGSIPSEVGNLTKLTDLRLENNQLSGSIPTELGNLTSLTNLSLRDNKLTGSIPSELGRLTKLTSLLLSKNKLTGSMPPELGNLTSLTNLSLGDNKLTGSIPSELGRLTKLTSLLLSKNKLTGSMPPELGNLTSLTQLWLGDHGDVGTYNQLTGSIPSEVGNLTKLTNLSLENNQLSGSIPTELGNLTSLTHLSLRGNQLTGSIPSELGGLDSLVYLFLVDNQLTGSIPSELGNLSSLTTLFLQSNQLTGAIPRELGNLFELMDLLLYENQLTDAIPPELGRLSHLWRVDLSSNALTGQIPSELGGLDSLSYLALQSNPLLSGGLPLSLAGLSLGSFYYWGTDLCVPQDTAFQAWLGSIRNHNGTEVICPVPTATVFGTVRSGGDPVHGVTILVNGGRPIGATQDYTTGEDGTYAVTVPVGNVTISAWKRDMSFSPSGHTIRATEGIVVSGFDFSGFAHATISGRVLTTDGGPFNGVTVTATPAGGGPATDSYTTDVRGVYSLSVPFGSYTIDASRPGYSFGPGPTVNVGPGQAISVADLTATATAEPVNVAARRDTTDNANTYGTTATVTWDVGPGGKAKSYRVQTREGSGSWTAAGDAVDSASVTNDSVSTSIGNVPEDAFSVRVLAILGDSDRDTLPSVAVAVAAVNPLPSGLEATRNTDAEPDSLVVTWEARGNAQSRWRVAISFDDGADWYVAQGTASGGSWGTTLESTNFSDMANADPEESDTKNATADELNGAFMIRVDYRQGETDGQGQVVPWEVGPTATVGAK